MSDFSFMRSGFDNIQDAVDDEEMKKNVVSIIVKFAEGALKTASKYALHREGLTVVLPEDIKRAMMLEMFLFKHRDNLLEEVETLKQELFDENSDDDEYLEDMPVDDDIDDEDIEFTESECTCAICRTMNNIYNMWETLEITSPYEALLKQHIENMC